MKIKRNFIKVKFTDYFNKNSEDEGYIDITRIIAIYDEGLGRYRVDSLERSYYITKESYDKLVEVLYGKTYN